MTVLSMKAQIRQIVSHRFIVTVLSTKARPLFYNDCVKNEGPDTTDSIPETKEDNVIKKN